MARYLSQEWLDESTRLAADQPEREGVSTRLQFVINGGPDGDVEFYWVIVDGKLVENRLGRLEDAEVTLSEDYEDAVAIQKGELDVNAAFMQGRMRPSGDLDKLMNLLPITMSPEYQAFNEAVAAMTEY